MIPPLIWTDAADAVLIRMRAEGATWDAIGNVMMICRTTVIRRSKVLGVEKPLRLIKAEVPVVREFIDVGREPLRAGHPVTWGIITAGTLLDGEIYPVSRSETWPPRTHGGRFCAAV